MRYKKTDWPQVIAEWRASGLDKLTFCTQRNISRGMFYKYLAVDELKSTGSKQVKAKPVLEDSSDVKFIELVPESTGIRQIKTRNNRCLVITTANGCRIEVPL